MANNNPLSGYYRAPKLYTQLPSQGLFYDDSVVEMSTGQELPVFAMTAKDEMIMKNPDALLNGEAVAQVIKSCVPAVKKPRALISNDVDTLLVAIQGATQGDEVDVTADCPECKEVVSAVASIESCLSTMTTIAETESFTIESGLTIEIRPFTYESTVQAGITNFQSTRSLQAIAELKDEIDQLHAFNENFMRMAALNFNLIVDSVSSIKGTDPAGEDFIVTDRDAIRDFLENCDGAVGREIEKRIKEINEIGVNKKLMMECDSCGHQFEKEIGFDPVNFSTAS